MVVSAASCAGILAISGLDPPNIDADVLGAVWQVQATLLGLAVAVSVFAYQSFESVEGSHRRLILLTGYPATIVVGLSLVLLSGAAFINRTLAITQWLGAIAVTLTGVWVMLLLLTLSEAPHIQNRRFALGMRLRVLRRNTALLVQSQLTARASSFVLAQRMSAAGGRHDPWPAIQPGDQSVMSARAGVITDINLQRLDRASREIATRGGEFRLSVGLYQRVEANVPIGSANVEISPQIAALVQSALVFGSRQTPSIDDDLLDLHAEATKSLDAGTDILNEILEAYYGVLDQYATAWLSFVAVLETEHLPSWLESQQAPTSQIRDSVARLFKRSVEGRFRDAAYSLVYFPLGVMQRAVRWQAPGYFDFLSMYPNFYWLATREWVPSEMRMAFAERAWWHPVEARDLILPALARGASVETVNLIERAGRLLDETILNVLRSCIREGDRDNFQEGLRRWRIANR